MLKIENVTQITYTKFGNNKGMYLDIKDVFGKNFTITIQVNKTKDINDIIPEEKVIKWTSSN